VPTHTASPIWKEIAVGFGNGAANGLLTTLAVASSIFVTRFTDVGGFFSFLGLATLAMRYFPHP